MKKILIIITILINLYNYSQSPILSLEQDLGWKNNIAGAYYKDLDNVLDTFEGTWLYTNGTTSLKIVLVKKSVFFEGSYYEDLMVGEYQYIENGTEKINTLSNLNQNLGYSHKITGNDIHRDCDYLPVVDCTDGEARLVLGLIDPNPDKSHWATMTVHKRTINGQEAIRVFITFTYTGDDYQSGVQPPSPTLPWQQEYIMFKQP